MTKHKEVLELALDTHIKNESHRTVEETRYWCDQYKLLAQTAIKALAQHNPLTDEQLEMMWRDGPYDHGTLYDFKLAARATEAAHGIKGKA